jgi:hypothetical protein
MDGAVGLTVQEFVDQLLSEQRPQKPGTKRREEALTSGNISVTISLE